MRRFRCVFTSLGALELNWKCGRSSAAFSFLRPKRFAGSDAGASVAAAALCRAASAAADVRRCCSWDAKIQILVPFILFYFYALPYFSSCFPLLLSFLSLSPTFSTPVSSIAQLPLSLSRCDRTKSERIGRIVTAPYFISTISFLRRKTAAISMILQSES